MNIPAHAKRIHWLASFRYLTAAIFGTIGISGQFNNEAGVWVGATLFALVWVGAIGFGTLRWWRFRYWVEDGRIRGQTGGMLKTEIDIPFEKIQAVNLTSPIVYRVFGLKRVSVKTAATGTQLELTAVSAKEAESFKHTIEQKGAAATSTEIKIAAQPTVSRKLSTPEIMIAAATSRQFLVALGAVTFVANEVSQFFEAKIFKTFFESFTSEEGFTWASFDWTLVLVPIAVLFVAWVVTVLYTVLVFRAFTVTRTDGDEARIQIKRGLGEIQEIGIPARRIQAVEFVQTPLQLLVGYGSIQIRVIGHAEEKGANTVLFPCISKSDWQAFLDDFLTGFVIETSQVRAPIRALPRFLLRGIRWKFLFFGFSALMVFTFSPIGAAATLAVGTPFFLIGLLLAYIDFRVESVACGAKHVTFVIQNWSRTTAVVRRDAYQMHIVNQNFFQRRLDLVSFGVMVASGPVGVTHQVRDLDANEADQFAKWVESHA